MWGGGLWGLNLENRVARCQAEELGFMLGCWGAPRGSLTWAGRDARVGGREAGRLWPSQLPAAGAADPPCPPPPLPLIRSNQ